MRVVFAGKVPLEHCYSKGGRRVIIPEYIEHFEDDDETLNA